MLGRSFKKKKKGKNLLKRQGDQEKHWDLLQLPQSPSSEFQTCVSCWLRDIIPN